MIPASDLIRPCPVCKAISRSPCVNERGDVMPGGVHAGRLATVPVIRRRRDGVFELHDKADVN